MFYVYLAPAWFLFFDWWYVAMLTLQRGNAHKLKRNEIRNFTARKLTAPDLSNISLDFVQWKGCQYISYWREIFVEGGTLARVNVCNNIYLQLLLLLIRAILEAQANYQIIIGLRLSNNYWCECNSTHFVLLRSVSPLSHFWVRYNITTFSQYCFIFLLFFLLCLMCLIGTVHALIVNWSA